MPLSKDEKLQAIEARRSGPEANLYGAELDLKLAEAAEDEYTITAAKQRVEAYQAQVDALAAAVAELNSTT